MARDVWPGSRSGRATADRRPSVRAPGARALFTGPCAQRLAGPECRPGLQGEYAIMANPNSQQRGVLLPPPGQQASASGSIALYPQAASGMFVAPHVPAQHFMMPGQPYPPRCRHHSAHAPPTALSRWAVPARPPRSPVRGLQLKPSSDSAYILWPPAESPHPACGPGVLVAVPSAPGSPHPPASPSFYAGPQGRYMSQASRLPSREASGNLPFPYTSQPGSHADAQVGPCPA